MVVFLIADLTFSSEKVQWWCMGKENVTIPKIFTALDELYRSKTLVEIAAVTNSNDKRQLIVKTLGNMRCVNNVPPIKGEPEKWVLMYDPREEENTLRKKGKTSTTACNKCYYSSKDNRIPNCPRQVELEEKLKGESQ